MKLSSIAVSVAVIFGASVVGGSWYTGNQIEEQYKQWVDLSNTQLKKLDSYGLQATIKNVSIERHFFSSDVHYDLEVTGFDGKATSYTFNGNDIVHHGPFPINRLTSLKLMPVMASIENHITAPETFRAYLKQDEFLSGYTDVNYSEDKEGKFVISPIESVVEEGGTSFKFATIDVKFDLDKSRQGKVEITTPKVTIQDAEFLFDIEDGEFSVDAKDNTKYVYLIEKDSKVKLKKLSFTHFEDNSVLVMDDVEQSSEQKFKDNGKIAIDSDVSSKKVAVTKNGKTAELGKLKLESNAKLDALVLDQSLAYIYQNSDNTDVEKLGNDWYLKLLASEPEFNFEEISLENDKGKTELSLDIALKKFDPNNIQDPQDIIAIFNKLGIKAKLSIPFTEEFITQLNTLDPNASQPPEKAVEGIVKFAKDNPRFLTVDDKNIYFNLETKDGDVYINEKLVPKKEVESSLMLFAFFMMGTFK